MSVLARIFVLCLIHGFLWSQDQGPIAKQDSGATIIFTGDLNFAQHFEYAMKREPFDVFANWGKIGIYDLMMVNLENPVTRSKDSVKKEFVFKMKHEYLSFFPKGRISLVNCANNHTGNFHIKGILETISKLDSAGIKHVGIGRNLKEAREPVILTIKGIRVGFLGYADIGTFIAQKRHPGRMPIRKAFIIEDLRNLRTLVDYIVVNLHWGEELAEYPYNSQISLAHHIIDEGADLIIGHHPHILQGIERYRGKVIAYSLGNFVFGGNSKSANCETAVLKVNFNNSGMNAVPIPVRVRNWKPEPADSTYALQVFKRLRERSKIFHETIISGVKDE